MRLLSMFLFILIVVVGTSEIFSQVKGKAPDFNL